MNFHYSATVHSPCSFTWPSFPGNITVSTSAPTLQPPPLRRSFFVGDASTLPAKQKRRLNGTANPSGRPPPASRRNNPLPSLFVLVSPSFDDAVAEHPENPLTASNFVARASRRKSLPLGVRFTYNLEVVSYETLIRRGWTIYRHVRLGLWKNIPWRNSRLSGNAIMFRMAARVAFRIELEWKMI